MTAPTENPASEAPPAPTPADMPSTQPPVAAAPTTEKPEGATSEPVDSTELTKLRREAAKYRTERNELQQQQTADKAAREQQAAEMKALKDQFSAIGAIFNPDANQPPDPKKLAEQIAAKDAEIVKKDADYQAKIRDLSIRAALPGVLAKAQAKPLTEKVLKADGVLAKLDPTSDTFAADLESAVNAALEADPDLKIAAPAARPNKSGAEIPGRSGSSNQLTREEVTAMAKIPGALDKARREGRLKNLGVG